MNTLKISIFRRISCFHQCLKSRLHKCAHTSAENGLLTKEICLRLHLESSLQYTCSCSAQSLSIGQCPVKCFARSILMNRYQTGSSSSNLILASYCMPGSLGSDHCHIYVLRRSDLAEMDRKAVCKHQHIALLQVGLDRLFVHLCLLLIIDQDHNNICPLCRLSSSIYLKSLLFGFLPGLASLIETYDDFAPGISKILSMCVSLASIADNGNCFALQQTHITIFLIINLNCHVSSSCFV